MSWGGDKAVTRKSPFAFGTKFGNYFKRYNSAAKGPAAANDKPTLAPAKLSHSEASTRNLRTKPSGKDISKQLSKDSAKEPTKQPAKDVAKPPATEPAKEVVKEVKEENLEKALAVPGSSAPLDAGLEAFVSYMRAKAEEPLPGVGAQLKMLFGKWKEVPFYTSVMQKATRKSNPKPPKPCAVLILFYVKDGQVNFVLTERTAQLRNFAGDVSLPGGKYEEEDATLEVTAKRETFEEIGVPMEDIEIISELTQAYSKPGNMLVNSYIGFYKPGLTMPKSGGEPLQFKGSKEEVAKIIEVPVAELLDENKLKSRKMKVFDGEETDVPFYALQGTFVYGLTAGVLSELKEMLLH